MRIAVLDDIHDFYGTSPAVGRLRDRAEVQVFTQPFGPPEALAGFQGLVANRERTRFTRELLQRLPDLRIIAQTGTHAYHIDFAAAHELGIVVGQAAGGASNGAIELTIGLMIAVMRHIPQAHEKLKHGEWSTPLGYELTGKTLGIVGMGKIGLHIARIAQVLNMKVLAYGRSFTPARAAELGIEQRELDDLLHESDVVSVHASLNPTSIGLLDARRLGLMKPSAYLINTARGAIVDEKALVEALSSGRIRGAALDVFEREPLPAGHPLTKLDNVVLTPHLGWPTANGYERFAEGAVDVLLAFMDGRDVPRFPEDKS